MISLVEFNSMLSMESLIRWMGDSSQPGYFKPYPVVTLETQHRWAEVVREIENNNDKLVEDLMSEMLEMVDLNTKPLDLTVKGENKWVTLHFEVSEILKINGI